MENTNTQRSPLAVTCNTNKGIDFNIRQKFDFLLTYMQMTKIQLLKLP